MAIKIASKGYTIEVRSWENDGDNYRTERITVDTLHEAKKIRFLCEKLFSCEGDTEYSVGNTMEGEGHERVKSFITNHPEWNFTEAYISKMSWELLGGSEFYDYRVCESVTVTYLACDIFAEEIL
jgi:hypothetical protein